MGHPSAEMIQQTMYGGKKAAPNQAASHLKNETAATGQRYTYLRWHGEVLSAENKKQFLIPAGFAHGFLVLSQRAEFCYKVTDFFHPDDEGGIPWDDPKIGVITIRV